MSQRINITYSIKFEELQTEIRRLLTVALDTMEDTCSDHSHLSESPELLDLETFKSIDGLRKELADIDVALADVNNLIASYLDYEVQRLSQKSSTPESEIASQETIQDPLIDLNQKLALFKEQWATSQAEKEPHSDEISD